MISLFLCLQKYEFGLNFCYIALISSDFLKKFLHFFYEVFFFFFMSSLKLGFKKVISVMFDFVYDVIKLHIFLKMSIVMYLKIKRITTWQNFNIVLIIIQKHIWLHPWIHHHHYSSFMVKCTLRQSYGFTP